MYSVSATVEGITMWLHDDTVSNPTVKLIDPVLTLEDSNAGSFTFKLAPNNIGYTEVAVEKEMVTSVDPATGETTTDTITTNIDLVSRMRSIIKIYRDGTEIWEGRVLSEDRDFQNLRNIYCEGELAYLNDVCLPQRKFESTSQNPITGRQFLEYVINYYNTKVNGDKKFVVGYVTAHGADGGTLDSRITNFENCLAAVNKLVEDYGGHLRIRKVNGVRTLDWIADYENTSTQVIKFGENLLDFTCNWDMSDLCTVLLPTGEVIQQASSSTVGDPVTPISGPTQGGFLYLNTTENKIMKKTAYNLGGYRVATYNVTPGATYYLSCRLHGGLVAYAIYDQAGGVDGQGMVLTYKQAGQDGDIGFADFVDEKITINTSQTVGSVYSISICGWGTDIPVCLKTEIEPPEDYDKYLTIEQCPTDVEGGTGKCWHQLNSVYICNPDLVTKYGWIEKHASFGEITDKDELYTAAKTYLQSGQFDKMSIEVSAIDLHALDVNTDAINLLDWVRVISEPHGINQDFPVTKLEIPLDRPEDQRFTIGSKTEQTLTSVNNDIDTELLAKINGIPNMSKTLESAKLNAGNMIMAATHGYVTLVDTDDDGQPDALVISDVENPSSQNPGHNCWIFNTHGLGHFAGYPQDPTAASTNVALTMDGSIVADRITTGTLASININGCTATFGGIDDASGILTVLSRILASNNYYMRLKDGGFYFGRENTGEFANIRGNKSYYVGNDPLPGVVITVGDYNSDPTHAGVLALDIDHLWVSEHSSGGSMNTRGGYEGVFSFKDGDGNTQDMRFVHGILTEITITQPAQQEGGE